MKKMESFKERLTAMIMMVVMATTVLSHTVAAEAATAMNNVSIVCYLRGNSRANTYQSVNGAYSGYIDANDQCTILAVYDSGWVKVSYPVNNGKNTKTAYTQSSNFFVNTDFATSKVNAGSNYTVYKKSNLASSLGTVYGSDNVILVGKENGKQQIIYPLSGTSNKYKMGFINGTISAKTNITTVTASTIEGLCFDYIYYADKYSDLKAAFNYNKEKLYSHWKNYGIKEGRSASPILDLEYYLKNNKDLYKAFGSDYVQVYNHFITFGYKEFRASSPYYNGQMYRSNYTDLRNFDSASLITHYYYFGIAEKRQAGEKLFTGSYSGAQGNSSSSTNASSSSIAEQIVAYELSQLGTSDYKGNNNVKYNTWYYGREVSGSGYAWCMAFQSYCANKLGVLNTAIPRENNCADAVNWYKSRGQFHYAKSRGGNYTPKAGDLVFYYSNGGVNHVGMITAAPVNGYLQTVEGNIVCSDGNWKVVQFTKNAKRTVDNSYVYGYATPNY